ncbi:MAG: tetratricopeptide repeat protein [Burkholderiaceae bacterium]|nr:tetratricopeptide repeat protein [Burkholderiaceae bacterium]
MSATANDPTLPFLHQARDQIARGDLSTAAKTLNKALQKWPRDPRVFMLAGVMAEKSGNLPGAFDALRRAVTFAPDWAPGLLELALLLARTNQFPEAISTAEKVAELEPKNLKVLAHVVDIAHRASHTEMAVRHLRRGLELVPGDATLRRTLAQDLSTLGQTPEALDLWNALLAETPDDAQALVGRVQTWLASGKPGNALADTTALLRQAPDDAVYQYYDQLARGETPAQQPPALIRPLFDGMAELYDLHMVRGLQYRLPQQVAEKVTALYPDKKINVLDLGCGTGLLGLYLGPLDGFLIGVDLSTKMVEQAARHQVYDRFHTVNLHDALRETPESLYQVITALDVFIYAGELSQAVPDAWRILTPGGHLVFSCEATSKRGATMVLQPSGRYAHKRTHIEKLCKAAGFKPVAIEEVVLRLEINEPVMGFVVTAQKPV